MGDDDRRRGGKPDEIEGIPVGLQPFGVNRAEYRISDLQAEGTFGCALQAGVFAGERLRPARRSTTDTPTEVTTTTEGIQKKASASSRAWLEAPWRFTKP